MMKLMLLLMVLAGPALASSLQSMLQEQLAPIQKMQEEFARRQSPLALTPSIKSMAIPWRAKHQKTPSNRLFSPGRKTSPSSTSGSFSRIATQLSRSQRPTSVRSVGAGGRRNRGYRRFRPIGGKRPRQGFAHYQLGERSDPGPGGRSGAASRRARQAGVG